MHIQLTSDLHGRLPAIPECDVLVIAGDVCPDFHHMSRARLGAAAQQGRAADVGLALQAQWLDTEFREWLNLVPAEHIIGIAGNHRGDRFAVIGDRPAKTEINHASLQARIRDLPA